MRGTRPPITGYRTSATPGSLLDVLSYDQFRAVIASPPHRAQYGLEVSPATVALLGTDENTAQSFYRDWTRDGQPRLSAMPAQAPEPTFAPPAVVAAQPTYAPPATAATPQPTYAPPATAAAPQPTYAPPATAATPQPSYAPAVSQFSRDPQLVASSGPAPYAPMVTTSQAQPSGSGSGLRNIVIGFGIALVGTIVTVVSYNSSGPGGTFVVAWGAILFGAIQGIRGIVQQLKG